MDTALLNYLPHVIIGLIGLLIRRELGRLDSNIAELLKQAGDHNARLIWLEATSKTPSHQHHACPTCPTPHPTA